MNLKIGIFTDAYIPQIGGVSTSTQLLRNELMRRGHEVYVFTTTDPNQPKDEINTIRVPSLPFVSSKRVALNYNPLLHMNVRSMKFDVIHTQTEFGLGIFGRIICRQDKIPHVHTYHTIYEDWMHGQLKSGPIDKIACDYMRRMSRTFCNSAAHVIVPTVKTKDLLLEYGVHKPIRIIPTGIDLSRFRAARQNRAAALDLRQKLNLDADDKVLLYLGRISEEKNIAELFQYLLHVLPREPKLKFILVGEGPARNSLMQFSERHKLNQQVFFTGLVSLEEVESYYAMADIFVSASQSETQGLTYIEALAGGLPVLAKKDPCLDGVVESGMNGYIFENDTEFYEQLDSLLRLEPDAAQQLSRRAMQSSQAFSVECFAEQVEEVYRKAIAANEADQQIPSSL